MLAELFRRVNEAMRSSGRSLQGRSKRRQHRVDEIIDSYKQNGVAVLKVPRDTFKRSYSITKREKIL